MSANKASGMSYRKFLLILIAYVPLTTLSQVNSEKYRDLFLVGEFGEVCTMCEVTVLCEAGATIPSYEELPETGSFTLYHLRTRTFWSQVSTIWEWFVANFNSESLAQGHSRPVDIYTVKNGDWSRPATHSAHISLEPALLIFGDHDIDRADQSWRSAKSQKEIGFCQRVSLWDALDVIADNANLAEG